MRRQGLYRATLVMGALSAPLTLAVGWDARAGYLPHRHEHGRDVSRLDSGAQRTDRQGQRSDSDARV